jgi:predicted RNase H-like nuclease (RuvC/YqgF family)
VTYSQRLSGGASLSDVLHLEYEIEKVKQERVEAANRLKRYEQGCIRNEREQQEVEAAEIGEAQVLQAKLADARTQVNSLTTRLEELEAALDELVD